MSRPVRIKVVIAIFWVGHALGWVSGSDFSMQSSLRSLLRSSISYLLCEDCLCGKSTGNNAFWLLIVMTKKGNQPVCYVSSSSNRPSHRWTTNTQAPTGTDMPRRTTPSVVTPPRDSEKIDNFLATCYCAAQAMCTQLAPTWHLYL